MVWGLGEVVWGGNPCYYAETSTATTLSGPETVINFDTIIRDNATTTGSNPVDISAAPDPPNNAYSITVLGVLTSAEAVTVTVNIYDEFASLSHTASQPVGPGTDVPFSLLTDYTAPYPVTVEVVVEDPDEGGGELDAGASIEICPVTIT